MSKCFLISNLISAGLVYDLKKLSSLRCFPNSTSSLVEPQYTSVSHRTTMRSKHILWIVRKQHRVHNLYLHRQSVCTHFLIWPVPKCSSWRKAGQDHPPFTWDVTEVQEMMSFTLWRTSTIPSFYHFFHSCVKQRQLLHSLSFLSLICNSVAMSPAQGATVKMTCFNNWPCANLAKPLQGILP